MDFFLQDGKVSIKNDRILKDNLQKSIECETAEKAFDIIRKYKEQLLIKEEEKKQKKMMEEGKEVVRTTYINLD